MEIKTQVNQTNNSLAVLSSSENSIILELNIPRFDIETKLFQGKEFDILNITEFAQTGDPGKPQLPVKGYLFGIPLNTISSLEILETKFKTSSPINIFYTPQIANEPDTTALRSGLPKTKFEPFIDAKIANSNQFYPTRIAELENPAFIREQQIGKLTIFPIQYNPTTKEIRSYEKIKLKINFRSNTQSVQSQQPAKNFPGPFEKMLTNSLLNYDLAKSWRGKTTALSKKLLPTTNQLQMNGSEWYKIVVDEDGIYRLTKTDLINAGLNVSATDPQKIKIYYHGEEIPINENGEADGVFDDSDYIEFYGTATRNDYTYDNVYWLTVDTENGSRMEQQDGALTGTYPIVTKSETSVHFEQNNEYLTSFPDGEGEDHWFWDYVIAPNTLNINVTLNNVINISSLPCKLKVEYRGYTHTSANPDHHTIAYINGHKVLDNLWDGQAKLQTEGDFNQGYIFSGSNTVNINLPGDTEATVDYVYINWIEIKYWQDYNAINDVFTFTGRNEPGTRQFEVAKFSNDNISIFDITDSTNVKKINGSSTEQLEQGYTVAFQDENSSRRYLALTSSKIKSPKSISKDNGTQLFSKNNQADYIIITHENFYNSAATLADFRQDQGLEVITVKVEDVYDEFNYGVKNPSAIKDFLSYAYSEWRKPSPTYVLLIGDASFDYKHYWEDGEIDLLPTHLFESSVYNTETSSDNWFACIVGEDVLPDILLGRMPVRTNEQLNIIINKIINYEKNPEAGAWNKNVVFVADNADVGGNFEGLSDHFSDTFIPQDFNSTKVYLRDYNNDAEQTRTEIINNINNGCLVVNYLGHGQLDYWASEKIFESNQVPNLTNNVKVPLIVTMGNLNGFFHHARTTYCLAEDFLKANNGGSVACFSQSGFGYTIGDQYLGDGLYNAIFNDNDYILGSAVMKAKLSLFSAGSSFYDHISFFNLLGDPALQLYITPTAINVESEWNLISLPRIPEDASVESILGSIGDKWKKLLTYSNGTWVGADADIPSTFWTLKQMELGKGYWLQTTEQGQILVTGTEKSNAIPVSEGWNLIGNSTPLNHPISEALSSIDGSWKKLLYYQNGSWYGADVSLPSNFWTLNELKSGAGYWLEVANDDTLDITRIPSPTNSPGFSPEMGNTFVNSDLSNKQFFESKRNPDIPIISSDKNYRLSITKPSGYYGTVFLRDEPAPSGSKISAWINDVLIPPEILVTNPGKYDLLLLNGDDLNTSQIEGGKQGDQIVFKIQTPSGETFASDTKTTWEEGINHRFDLFVLSNTDSASNPISIKLMVDDRLVGRDILDGDPISNKSTISAIFSGGPTTFSNDNVSFHLNSEQLEKGVYSYIPNTESSETQGRIVYLPNTLIDGEYNLKVEVIDANTSANTISENFSFLISNTLKLEKVVNYPNPMQGDTKFTYYLLNDDPADVSIKLYTVAGRLIKVINSASNQIGYNETYWDGTDEFGDKLANGVYFYKIIAKSGSEKTEVIERLVVMR